MPAPLLRAASAALLLGSSAASAQPVPPAPPAHAAPATAKPGGPPVVQPAPRTKVHAAPLKPGAHPTTHKPATKPRAKPATPAPAVVAAPAPAPDPAPEPEKPAEPTKGSNTGNPLPRYATLRSDEVNLRTGPGTRYPIEWQYKRRDLPVLIEREFEVWRLIRDPDGVKGWVHQATLAPRRTGVVIGGEHSVRQDPKPDGSPVARLKPGVIVRIRSCEATADWCQVQIQEYRGWLRRADMWGVLPGEMIQ